MWTINLCNISWHTNAKCTSFSRKQTFIYPPQGNKVFILFITAALRCQNTFEKHHNILSHLKIGRAAQGPCDFLCSHEGQTLPLQSRWISSVSLYFQPEYCPCCGDQEEYPLYVGSWSSSMLEPSPCEMGETFQMVGLLLAQCLLEIK